MEITGGAGVKCVIDGIGASTTDISIECLARRGIFVTFGNASGPVPAFPPIRLIKKSAFLTRPKLLDYVSTRDELMGRAEEIFGWIQSGELKVGRATGSKLPPRPSHQPFLSNPPLTSPPVRPPDPAWLQVGIDKVFSLKDAVAGHKFLESGASKGKVLYKVD